MNKILEVKDICKTYVVNKRQNNVLRNVSFDINEGEMIAVMGPSGSGKSTLLYAVSGMDKASGGSVMFDGDDITKMKDNKLAKVRLDKMGFIFQQMFMMKNLTILDNITLPAVQSKKENISKAEKYSRGEELMRKLGIIDVADNDINEVSGGQLQRACICRALINAPKIVFADEPTGNLDSNTTKEILELMRRLVNEQHKTLVMVTHDRNLANVADRVIQIRDGRIKKIEVNEEKEIIEDEL